MKILKKNQNTSDHLSADLFIKCRYSNEKHSGNTTQNDLLGLIQQRKLPTKIFDYNPVPF